MLLAAVDFDNLHQVLRVLYDEMMPLCGNMTGVAKGIAGLGALFLSLIHIWETYFQKVELADRQPLYVSRTTHEKLMRIVTVIGGRKVTVSSYVENILLRHFEQYQDEINTLYESHFQKPV